MKKYILLILIPFLAFTFTGNPPGGWYQQTLPDLGGQSIQDIIFLDSLNGLVISSKNVNPDSSSILKTTNGGDNWQVVFSQTLRRLSSIKFINSLTGFVSGGSGGGTPYLYKTTNGGDNWFTLPGATLGTAFWNDMSVLNEDTIYLVDANGFNGGIFRTTNGGINWVNQIGGGMSSIYMINKDSGFASRGSNELRRTTNSGLNWILVNGETGFSDMEFADNSTGWKCNGTIKKTTDGGDTWIQQSVPTGGSVALSDVNEIKVINKDTVWGVGGIYQIGSGFFRGLIWRTTNGGTNWGYQIPDTNFTILKFYHLEFTDNKHGWATGLTSLVHTITGGNDTTFFTGIEQISSEIPGDFQLYQNYPNPFNPTTSIKFKVQSSKNVKLSVFGITGKEIATLVNEKLPAGEYEYQFDGSDLTSGVYFYRLSATGGAGGFIETKKMLLVK